MCHLTTILLTVQCFFKNQEGFLLWHSMWFIETYYHQPLPVFFNTKKVEPPSFLLRKKKSSNEDEWGDAVPLFLVVVCVCWNLGWFGRLLMPLLYFCLTVLRQEDLPAYLVPWLMTMLQNTFCSILSRVIHSTWREKTRGGKHWLLTELLRAWQKLAETLQKL